MNAVVIMDERRAEDVDLMRRVARSEEAGMARLYDRFANMIYRTASLSLTNRCDLESFVQGVFVVLWRTADRYDPQRAALVTWVMLITRRQIIDALRRLRRASDRERGPVRSPVANPGVDSAAESSEMFARVIARMETLNELQRTVLTRAYLRGQPLRRIGEDLSTPLGTIKTALNRGVHALRADLAR